MSRPVPALIAVGAAAVIVLAAVALIAKPAPNQKVGASPITAGPYTSPLFAYTLDVPAGWEVAPAVKPWPAGQRIETDPASVDTFSIPGSPINASMAVAAQPAPQGTTSSTWLSKWEAIREDIGGRCFGSSVGWMTATVVGLPAWHVKWRCDSPTDERSNWDEYTFLSGGMGYVISGNPTMIDRLLESFRVPSAVSVATPTPIATSTWTTYTSAQYGFTIRIPPGWTEHPASRAWSFAVDGRTFDPSSPARDSFLNQAQDVQVSVWSIPVEPGSGPSSEADLESWIEQYCQQTDEQPCTGIKDRATALCVERRDCHPGFLVPFKDDVLAFWPTVGDDASVTAVAVWRSDADPTVEPYGGAVNLLEAFLSTIDTGQSGPVYPAPLPSP